MLMTETKTGIERAAGAAAPTHAARNGYRLGDAVRLPSIEAIFEVVEISDSLLILRAPSGREVRASWRAVTKVRQGGQRHE